jgi:hypothetical protein
MKSCNSRIFISVRNEIEPKWRYFPTKVATDKDYHFPYIKVGSDRGRLQVVAIDRRPYIGLGRSRSTAPAKPGQGS